MEQDDVDSLISDDIEPDPELNRISRAVIGAAIEVHRRLGPDHLESAYEEALAIELEFRGIRFRRQVDIELIYRGRPIGKSGLDFLAEELVFVDLKAIERLAPVHTSQMISYLSITGYPLGLIINFNVPALRHGLKRIAGRPAAR